MWRNYKEVGDTRLHSTPAQRINFMTLPSLIGSKQDTKKALWIKRSLIILILLSASLRLIAIGWQYLQDMRTTFDGIPASYREWGYTAQDLAVQIHNSSISHINAFAAIVLTTAIPVIIIGFGLVGRLWEGLVGSSCLTQSKMTVKSMLYVIVWYTLPVSLGAILELVAGRLEIQNFLQNLVTQIIYGAIIGFLLYRMTKKTRPWVVWMEIVIVQVIIFVIMSFISKKTSSGLVPLRRTPETEPVFDLAKLEGFSEKKIFESAVYGPAAYVHTLFYDYVVVDPLLAQKHSRDLVGVVAHELGHWKDPWFHFVYLFRGLDKLIPPTLALYMILPHSAWFQAFGFFTEPIIGALPITEIVYQAFKTILLNPLELWHSRGCEYRADENAGIRGFSAHLHSFFIKSARTLPMFWSSRMYEFLFLTHPSVARRLENLKKYPLAFNPSS